MNIQKDILCKIGIHDWGKWSKAEHNKYADSGFSYIFQQRICVCCGKHSTRTEGL